MDYLPITVQMQDRKCLIVGGGTVAARKLRHLLKADSQVTLVSESFNREIEELAAKHDITLVKGWFEPEMLKDCYLAVAATDDRMINRQVSIAAQQVNVWVNVVDDLELSTFIMPAIIDRSPLLIAVSSSGISPVLARKIREKIEWMLPKSLGSLLEKLKIMRPKVKKKFSDFNHKRAFSEWYIENAIEDDSQLQKPADVLFMDYERKSSKLGKVYLVGAGPGSADLLTVKALKILQKADIVLHDALVTAEILDCVRRDAELVHVGKRANRHYVEQEDTNAMLVKYAQQGLSVVRLKGGDPFIFGRGGEELQVLARHGINYEVVPGITAASGCASYAGIPLTHREHSQSLRFVTAHEKKDSEVVDWESLAKSNQTLVFYMGLMRNEKIAASLTEYGLDRNTPVAVIEKGTTADQRVIVGKINELPTLVETYQVQSPALIIVGEVAALAVELDWYQSGELINMDLAQGQKQVANQSF